LKKPFWKNKKVKFVLKALVSAVLFSWVVVNVDWVVAWQYVLEVSFPLLFLYVFLLVGGILISSCKWRVLTQYKGFKKSCRWHFQTYLGGTFVNNFLPSTIGGDTYRALELGVNSEGKHSPGVSTIFFDRLTGLWSLALLGCVFSLLQYAEMIQHSFWIFMVVAMGLFLVIDFLLIFDKSRFFVRFGRHLSEPIGNLFYEISEFRDKQVIKKAFVLSVVFNLIGVGLANYVLFHALGLPVGIFQFLSVIFIINIVSAVPISVNNIGIKEWAYFVFFGYLGLSTDIAVTVAIVSRFIQMLVSFFALPGYIKGRRR
jgi:uncharacterized protein (TIRG00374 family)